MTLTVKHELGHEEFERLCQALAQKIIAPGVKVFGMGKDGAREVTYEGKAPYPSAQEPWSGNWIIQAKFHDTLQLGPNEARRCLVADLDDELHKITDKYQYNCSNYILITNVSLTPAFQTGTRDKIDNVIVPKYEALIKNIHVWGADEVCRFLDGLAEIRQSYAHLLVPGDVIARLIKFIDARESDLDVLVGLYCEGCFNHEQYAALDDAGDVDDKRIALQRVFVDLDVELPDLPKEESAQEKLPRWLKQAAEDENRTSALSYLLDDSLAWIFHASQPDTPSEADFACSLTT